MLSKNQLKNFESCIAELKDNKNVYRTDKYIVVQHICFTHNIINQTLALSHDTYYKRCHEIDKIYNKYFSADGDVYEGARVKAKMHVRIYPFGI